MPDVNGGNGHGAFDKDAQVRALASALLSRYRFARQAGITFGGKRDEYTIFGYDDLITTQQYRSEYERGGIAGRIVDALPKATWRGGIEVIEDEDPETDTAFEQAFEALAERLKIWAVLQRVDILSRLSTYAVLLIGAPGNFSEELPKGKPEQLAYLSPFCGGDGPGANRLGSSSLSVVDATIQTVETDATNPRFGLPLTYQLRRLDVVSPDLQRPVHWSRVIHIAEGTLDNELYGQPALARVWNYLIDLRKIVGGGAEAFFQRANQGLVLNLDKDATLGVDAAAKLASEVEDYQNNISRVLKVRGMDVQTLGSDVANFSNPSDAVLTLIAGATTIPKRILTGSEMGELASSQDRDNWRDQINGRQTGYAEPYIVRPLVDRLIQYGYLPTPKKPYQVKWAHIQTLTEQERTQGAAGWASVNTAQKNAGLPPAFTSAEIRDKWADREPLTPAELKAEAKASADFASAGAPPPPPAPEGQPVEGQPPTKGEQSPQLAAAESALTDDDREILRVLEAAIEADNEAVVAEIVGLTHRAAGDVVGHEFHGNQWTDGKGGTERRHEQKEPHAFRRVGDVPRVCEAVDKGIVVHTNAEVAARSIEQMAGRPQHSNLQRLQVEGQENRHCFGPHASERKRGEMPQLPEDKDGQMAFLHYLAKNGVEMKVVDADPRELMATQAELDSVKVGQIYKYLLEHDGKLRGETGPLFVSREKYIIDGHHRWASVAAYALRHPGTKVPVAILSVPIDKALKLSDDFGKQTGIGHEAFGAGFRQKAAAAHASVAHASGAHASVAHDDDDGFEPIDLTPPPPDAPPPPDDEHPWTWVNGRWIWIPTDTADGVPTKLDLE